MIHLHLPPRAALGLAALMALAAPAAVAESLGVSASSASSAGSASLGSVSDSVQGSSRSSAGDRKVAEGDYRVTRIAQLDGTPERLELLLLPLADAAATPPDDGAQVRVRVPRQALGAQGMAVGDPVRVRHRPYGLEFARPAPAGGHEPFLLALTDPWQRELASRPLGR